MIKVSIKNNIITITGHADFDIYGKDIICSAVSSIVITSVNAILSIDDKAISFKKDDKLVIKILKKDEITRKLIDNMLNLLKELEHNYPKNIKIKEE